METLDTREISESWQTSNFHVFWKDIAGHNRTIQLYDNERTFILTLEGFAGSGLLADDRVIVMAMREHLDQLNQRLQHQFSNLHSFIDNQQYIPININELMTLAAPGDQFDEAFFLEFMTPKLDINPFPNGVRVFSEMVTMLISAGQNHLVHQLDSAWNKLHQKFRFSHFRAFPNKIIESDNTPLRFYDEYSYMIGGNLGSSTDITYRPFLHKPL